VRKSILAVLVGLAILFLALPSVTPAQVAVGISVHIGPPALPVYPQPVCPAPGYIWTPGYWAWGPVGYYWVPGTWVMAPRPGFLWTPGYWGWAGGAYVWHGGYWGPHVGFYGGINYGFGYGGVGFVGGAWRGGVFAYNSAVTNVNTTVVRNVYVDKTVVNNVTVNNNVSYNGGTGGVRAEPTQAELAASNEHHIEPTAEQAQHEQMARSNPQLQASNNHGRPPIAATSRPGEFTGHGVVAARPANAAFHPPANNNHGAQGNQQNFHENNNGAQHQHENASAPHNNNPHPEAKPHNNPPHEQHEQRERESSGRGGR
jgi:WXXGXW repeat (2 copies)